jgi:hypothetical protein
MKTNIRISFILLAALFSLALCPVKAQVQTFQITDHVAWPSEKIVPGDRDCYMEFRETWTFNTRGTLLKEVQSQKLSCSGEEKEMPVPLGQSRIKDINYEFMLLDPHVMESGNIAFSEPDSMDTPTRNLQASLIELVEKYDPIDKDYNPAQQLLSVWFHEQWEVNPETGVSRKKVKAITPVIWQRRQSTEGRGIDDAETGLPVYYKNPLHKIHLRQP